MEGGLEKIQNLEDSHAKSRDEKTVETKGMAPVFTVPLSNINDLKEGESAHFEGRLIPTDDPKLKVCYYPFIIKSEILILTFTNVVL